MRFKISWHWQWLRLQTLFGSVQTSNFTPNLHKVRPKHLSHSLGPWAAWWHDAFLTDGKTRACAYWKYGGLNLLGSVLIGGDFTRNRLLNLNAKNSIRRNGFQRLPNIHSTKVERMLGECWMNGVFKRFQRHSTFSRTKEMLTFNKSSYKLNLMQHTFNKLSL